MITETEAVVLHAMNYRDTSKIVTLYSRKFGKIKIVAKGTRNQKTNTFGSSLEPMTHSSIVLYKKEHGDLHLLSKSEIVRPLNRMQDTADKMITGLALIELMNMVMHDEEENERLFLMLVESLHHIDRSEKNSLNVLFAFMVKMFDQFGFAFSLQECRQCGSPVQDQEIPFVMLRLSDGKVTCGKCSAGQSSGVKVNGGVLKTLQYFGKNTIEQSTAITLTAAVRDDIMSLLQAYVRYHIDGVRTLKSLSLLQSI